MAVSGKRDCKTGVCRTLTDVCHNHAAAAVAAEAQSVQSVTAGGAEQDGDCVFGLAAS